MIEALLGEVGRRLSDRWLIRALGPGLLWCAVAAFAVWPGRTGPFDLREAVLAAAATLDKLGGRLSLAVLCGALAVLGGALAGLTAQAAGAAARFVWLGQWPGPGRRLAAARTARRRQRAERRLAAQGQVKPAVYLPARPTWIGDRIRLTDDRVAAQYGLRLALIWPRLWQLLDLDTRTMVSGARDRFERAGTLAGWALLYAALTPWWWPAAVLGAGLAGLAWWRGRTSAALFAETVEVTVDLRHRGLVTALGYPLQEGRPLDAATADAINDQLHKGAGGYPQETAAGAVSAETPYPSAVLASDRRERQQSPRSPAANG
jgi:hypothetical protein